MKIAIVHNRYAIPDRGSGEEVSLDNISCLLEERGHIVVRHMASSVDIRSLIDKVLAFLGGIYNPAAKRRMAAFLKQENPDAVLCQNLYPLLSPAILFACREQSVPVVMRIPNYRLLCPSGLFMAHGQICERCAEKGEYWCLLRNCTDGLFKSAGYALRSFAARRLGLIRKNVSVFMVLTDFAKKKLAENGYPANRIHVIRSFASVEPQEQTAPSQCSYVGFAGRLSEEKGVDTLLRCAKRLKNIEFRIAGGENWRGSDTSCLKNVRFLGRLDKKGLASFYARAKIFVVPSRWYEGLPVVALEAMMNARPIVATDIGSLTEVVKHGVNGFRFPCGDDAAMADCINKLWQEPERCDRMGALALEEIQQTYSREKFYMRLMRSIETAIAEPVWQ